MKIKNTLLIVALSGGLVACGSSSDGGSGGDGKFGISSDVNTFGTSAYRETHSDRDRLHLIGKKKDRDFLASVHYKGNDFIVIDGEEIRIDGDDSYERFYEFYDTEHVTLGLFWDKKKANTFLFAVGSSPTKDMPKGNGEKVPYYGEARLSDIEGLEPENRGAMFLVDFDKHELEGQIAGAYNGHAVKAKITGNTFAGNNTYNSRMDEHIEYTNHIEGGFYGAQAAEMAGTFALTAKEDGQATSEYDQFGVFGARKGN